MYCQTPWLFELAQPMRNTRGLQSRQTMPFHLIILSLSIPQQSNISVPSHQSQHVLSSQKRSYSRDKALGIIAHNISGSFYLDDDCFGHCLKIWRNISLQQWVANKAQGFRRCPFHQQDNSLSMSCQLFLGPRYKLTSDAVWFYCRELQHGFPISRPA